MRCLAKLGFWIARVVTPAMALLSCTICNDTYEPPAHNFSYDVSLISGLRVDEMNCSPESGAIAFYSTNPFLPGESLYSFIGYSRLQGRDLGRTLSRRVE